MQLDWIEVYQAENLVEANLIEGLMAVNSIKVQFKGASLSGALGEIPYEQTLVRVFVLEIKQQQAKKILLEYTHNKAHCEWNCTRCGEENGPGFEICWACQMDKNE